MKALRDLLGNLSDDMPKGKPFKAIIFSCFICTGTYLKEQLKDKYHIYSIIGATSTKEVLKNKKAFEQDNSPSLLICSDAAKEGHNLQFCQYLIEHTSVQ